MRTKTLDQLCAWLERTPMNEAIQTVHWIVPAVQTVHILAIAAVMSSMLMINLRLVGAIGRDQPLRPYSARFLPVIWWALPVLLATGIVMIVGEPVRSLENTVFQVKMLLVISAMAITLLYQVPLNREPAYWTLTGVRRAASVALALVSMTIWIAIVFAGRWIAYI
ncbi:MAG: hypothetical protein JWO70_1033 [Betaproteobacteria bacterium]|nr:hypothetical protein [Betaproteobacteria bacterium]